MDRNTATKQPLPSWTRTARIVEWVILAVAVAAFVVALVVYFRHNEGEGPLQGWAWVAATGALALLALILVTVRPLSLVRWRMVLSSVLASLVLAGGTVFTWTLISKNDAEVLSAGTLVNSPREAAEFLRHEDGDNGRQQIPVGVFVQQLSFDGPSAVKVSGYVWQRLPKGFPESMQGVVLPDAEDSYASKEVYRDVHRDGTTTVGWYFNARLAQGFDYERYPFDRQSVQLRLWSSDRADDSMTLVPDFRSYPPWDVQKVYGVDPGVVFPGWQPTFTSWSYQHVDYHTTLGGNTRPYAHSPPVPPDLYFNLGVAREWQAPLLSSLTRWLIVAFIIFLALFVYSKDKGELRPNLGFSTWAVITFSVSMLLVIVVDQTSVRQYTGTAMAYVEWFALALYVVIMMVALNAVLLTSRVKAPGLEWQDNRIAKLAYWPLLFAMVFAATLYVFSPRW
ncbi:ligand-gated ion channel [Streptomyces smaragdinus]|uniref:hypothetical protein n=1 Tax=Streptomyces smaragdinus TaxID=2585196 RepID=UPI001886A5C9|nr:hypothetical protein [Streptomyces smaragdinus]